MATTTLIDTTLSTRNIGSRTDFAGSPITDLTAEEDRFSQIVLAPGIVAPLDGFKVVSGGGGTMQVTVGSGATKVDYAVVAGVAAGQGNYLVRLDEAGKTLTLAAADPSLGRKDEVYIVIQDNPYDASSRGTAVLAVRQGDPAASPALPGPDGSWEAYLKLAEITVPASAPDITSATIIDSRVASGVYLGNQKSLSFTLSTGAPTLGGVSFGASVDFGGKAISGVGNVDGVDVSAHTHTGGAGGTIDHGNLGNLTTGDPHTQYVLESAHTKAAHDALNINADTVDGYHGADLALAGHTHAYAATSHTHSYAAVSHTHSYASTSHTHDDRYFTETEMNSNFIRGISGQTSGAGITASTSAPSGGVNGDIWIRY